MINLIKSAINNQDRGDIRIEVSYDYTEQNLNVKLHNTKPVSLIFAENLSLFDSEVC